MSALNLEVVTYALQKIGVVDETQSPTAEQGITALIVLNDQLADQAADGMRLGWYPQTNLAATAPLKDADIGPVKFMLARWLSSHYGITITNPVLLADIADAERRLTKRTLKYFESDLSELPRAQGGPAGGPGWI